MPPISGPISLCRIIPKRILLKLNESSNISYLVKGKKLDTWELLNEDNYRDEFEAEGDYPSSVMSAVQSLKLSPSFIVWVIL